jgi:RimJ/RimL family protein N-acetyltransferase
MLRPVELADADDVQVLFPQWEIVRYLRTRVPWPYPPGAARIYYAQELLPQIERGEAWCWSLRMKTQPARFVGAIMLQKNPREENDNRGFWLGVPWQRQGLMTEACDAVTDYWFDVLKFPVLRVPKAAANAASRRISEKQGMRVIASDEADFHAGRLRREIWEISAEEWRARKKPQR